MGELMTPVLMKKVCSGFLGALAVAGVILGAMPTRAQVVLNIVASVNEDIVTEYDIVQRIRYLVAVGNLPNDPKVIRSVRNRILNTLIEEKLQLAEAGSRGLLISSDQEEQILQGLAARFGVDVPTLLENNAKAGIDRDHLVDMLAASEVWSLIVRQRFGSRIVISETDIANQRIEAEKNKQAPERKVFELVLPLTQGEQSAQSQAASILDELKAGSDFSTLAVKHSRAPSARNGGELGWIVPERLPQTLARKLEGSRKGSVIGPVKFNNGLVILWIADTRPRQAQTTATTMVSALRVSFENVVENGNDPIDVANNYRAAASDCTVMEQLVFRVGAPSEDMGTRRLRDYPAPFHDALAKLPIGTASAPIVHDGGKLVSVVMTCRRQGGGAGEITDEELRNLLINRRLQSHSIRYMEELRRNAFIDIRQE